MKIQRIKKIIDGPARYPTIDVLEDQIVLYFSKKNDEGKSRVFQVSLDKDKPWLILEQPRQTSLELGLPGSFDQHGHAARCIISTQDRKFMYLMGWSHVSSSFPPYHLSIGFAEWIRDKWVKIDGPVMDRGTSNPFFASSPSVLFDRDRYKMWYISCNGWEMGSRPIQ